MIAALAVLLVVSEISTAMITITTVMPNRLDTPSASEMDSPITSARPVSAQHRAEHDAAAEQEDRAPVDARGLVPVERELPLRSSRSGGRTAGRPRRSPPCPRWPPRPPACRRPSRRRPRGPRGPGRNQPTSAKPEHEQRVLLAAVERRRASRRSSATCSSTPSTCLTSGRFISITITITATNITITIGSAMQEPLEEGDRLARLLLEQVAADQVRRAPDRQEQAADRDAVGDHEHQRGAEVEPLDVVLALHLAAPPCRPPRRHHADRDRQHHRRARGVRHHRRGQRPRSGRTPG